MKSRNRFDGLSKYHEKMIRVKAQELVNQHEFDESELEDLEQRLAICLLEQMSSHDASRSSLNTFFNHVLTNRASNMARSRRRKNRRFVSDFVTIPDVQDDEPYLISDLVSTDLYTHRREVGLFPDNDEIELKIDVQIIVEQLPKDLQEVCHELMRGTAAEAAEALGISRGTLYRRVAKIRECFAAKDVGRS